jgi:protein-S-isoprenylcysteine O-methyltransferase Ste14
MTTSSNVNAVSKSARGVARWVGQMSAALVIFGTIMFLSAGTLNWAAGWAYLAMNALTQILSGIVLIPRQPDMLAERSQVQEGTKDWDKFLAPLIVVFGTLAVLVTAGLDFRYGWSAPISTSLWVLGLTLAFCSQMFVLWAMASNTFFVTTVRIQDDRGHNVVSAGPYRFVRHPGYLGSIIYNLMMPLVLNSLWTFLPAMLTIILLIVRTRLEDRALQAELPGYREYTANVRFRLFPGVW